MGLILRLCALAIGLFVAVPAHAAFWAGAIPTDKLAGIHRVAVISALGDRVQIKKIGLMVFGNRATLIPIGDWGLDDLAVAAATSALSSRFQVETVAYDRASFLPNDSYFDPSRAHALEILVKGLPKSDVDAYVIIQKATLALPYPSNQAISGLGVGEGPGLTWPSKLFHHPPSVFAEYWVTLVRAGDGKTIGWRWSHLNDKKRPRAVDATIAEDPADWADTADQMTDGQKAALRKTLGDLVRQSISDTLQQLGLTG